MSLTISPIAWVKPRSIFDIPALEARIQDLEQVAAQPDFWDDQSKAQDTLQELSDYKASLGQLTGWQTHLDDTVAILELLQEDQDEALFQEAHDTATRLRQELDQWELQQLLSGPYDKRGAVLTINAGAGGTDAQDWAEMLLRMYTRWAERQGYQVHLVEMSEGVGEGHPPAGADFAL